MATNDISLSRSCDIVQGFRVVADEIEQARGLSGRRNLRILQRPFEAAGERGFSGT
jgi:hypothetical protein